MLAEKVMGHEQPCNDMEQLRKALGNVKRNKPSMTVAIKLCFFSHGTILGLGEMRN